MSIFTFSNRINTIFLALSIGLLLISACGEDGEKWSAHENNPIIQAGDFLQRAIWNDPCVLKEGGQYIMYMTTSPSDNPFNPPVIPYRAISDDGISWQLDSQAPGPLLDESGTPFASIETPSVVFFKNKYHMFFTGVYPEGGTHYMAVGHAVSDDGLLWVKDTAPLLEPTGNVWDWNGFLVAEPGAAVFKNKIYLYFTAMGQHSDGTQWQSIGLVTSNDGINFSSQKMVLEQSDKYPVSEGFVGYSTPSATVYDNRVHLFYDAAKGQPSYRQVALHHAVSDDGEPILLKMPDPFLPVTPLTGLEERCGPPVHCLKMV